jgi:exopolysaccharide biosynthesis polyprenyl glycosylphosphotransferase
MQSRTIDRFGIRWWAVAGDALAAAAALWLAREIRLFLALPFTISRLPPGNFRLTPALLGIAVVVQLFSMSLLGFSTWRGRIATNQARRLAAALFVELVIFPTIVFFDRRLIIPRSVLVVYLALDGLLLLIHRTIVRRLATAGVRGRALIVGASEEGRMLANAIARFPQAGIDVSGIAVPPGLSADGGAFILEDEKDLDRVIAETQSDHVLFASTEELFRDQAIEHLATTGRSSLWSLPSPYETLIGRLRFRPLGELPLLEVRTAAPQGAAAWAKRAFDVAAASGLLLLASPVLIFCSLVIRMTSGSPVIYTQPRVGRRGRIFRLLKLRTMQPGAENETGAVLAARDDPRVTRFGRFLRGARIDEIPQLFNVLRGEMSLVGPRPERPEFVERFERIIPGYALRLVVRPGLTGLAQVSGEYETDAKIKLRYDLAYVNNWSLGLDLLIVARTLPVILTRRGI